MQNAAKITTRITRVPIDIIIILMIMTEFLSVIAVVLKLDSNSKHGAHVKKENRYIEEKNPICNCFWSNQCLKQFKQQRLLTTCASISNLPSAISIMIVVVVV